MKYPYCVGPLTLCEFKNETVIFITTEEQKRIVDWKELNQLKKDILWIFDENTGQLNASFVPANSFSKKYWEYLTLDTDESSCKSDIDFYKEGVLIIILCMIIEYVDTTSGNQKIFGETSIAVLETHMQRFYPANFNQKKLFDIVSLGLAIAAAMKPGDLLNKDGYNHRDMSKFYSQLNWVDMTFIKSYFNLKTK